MKGQHLPLNYQFMNDKILIGGVIHHPNMCMLEMIGIPNSPGSAGRAFSIFGKKNISLEFISETEACDGLSNITCCFHTNKCDVAKSLHSPILVATKAQKLKTKCPVEIITIYGPHFASKPLIAAKFCEALGAMNINMLGITTSINSITCVIHSDYHDLAHKAIQDNFIFPQ